MNTPILLLSTGYMEKGGQESLAMTNSPPRFKTLLPLTIWFYFMCIFGEILSLISYPKG